MEDQNSFHSVTNSSSSSSASSASSSIFPERIDFASNLLSESIEEQFDFRNKSGVGVVLDVIAVQLKQDKNSFEFDYILRFEIYPNNSNSSQNTPKLGLVFIPFAANDRILNPGAYQKSLRHWLLPIIIYLKHMIPSLFNLICQVEVTKATEENKSKQKLLPILREKDKLIQSVVEFEQMGKQS
jgi:hypothetical protein